MVANNRKPHTNRNCLFVFGNNHSDCRTVGGLYGRIRNIPCRGNPRFSYDFLLKSWSCWCPYNHAKNLSIYFYIRTSQLYLYVCVHVASQLCSYKCRRTVT